VLVAVLIIPLLGFIGLATDAGRGYLIKARLGDALDAAALAGAQEVFSDVNFESDVRMYFEANFPPDFMGARVTLAPPQVDAAKEVVTLSATAEIDTTFMRLFGFETMQVASATEVTRRTTSMDVILSIDMSGSMGDTDGAGATRIEAARAAASTLVDILYGQSASKDLLNVGVVPWNGKVNVFLEGTTYDPAGLSAESVANYTHPTTGALQSDLYRPGNSPVALLSVPPADWGGCIYARYTRGGRSDDADHLLGPVTVGGAEWVGWEPVGVEGEPRSAGGVCRSCTPCLEHGITPLSNSKATVQGAIDSLTSPRGTTNIAQGLVWAWRVVTPGEPFDDADPFPKGRHQRAIVLLTDGEQFGRPGDGYKGAFGNGAGAGPNGMNARLRAVADSIKSQGIKIYTIQFFYDSGPLQELMQEIATEPKAPYYHYAPDGQALSEVFEEIANHLSELRLSR
jgi:Mg-chelatase subunit ChlD